MTQTRLGRICKPFEMANLAVFLASEEASFVSGTPVSEFMNSTRHDFNRKPRNF